MTPLPRPLYSGYATGNNHVELGIEPGEPVIRLLRQRLVDRSPVMLDIVLVSGRRAAALADADLGGSLYLELVGVKSSSPRGARGVGW